MYWCSGSATSDSYVATERTGGIREQLSVILHREWFDIYLLARVGA